jgi:hypothetical protein
MAKKKSGAKKGGTKKAKGGTKKKKSAPKRKKKPMGDIFG